MIYQIYKMEFLNNVRFGKQSLNETNPTLYADTLFSALYQEAMKQQKENSFYQMVHTGKLIFSDGFPYQGREYYLPKPYIRIEETDKKDNSKEKKKFKKLKYIPLSKLERYLKGETKAEEFEEEQELGYTGMKVSVAVRGKEEPEPYRVRYFTFQEGNGLYFLVKTDNEEEIQLLDELMTGLSYSGIGGKRHTGMGRFEYERCDMPVILRTKLETSAEKYMLLSTALPEENELEQILEQAEYQLLKRSGFVASTDYADQQMRKRDLYVFQSGSCFGKTFSGQIVDVSDAGRHPVYRYAMGIFMGVG